MIATSDPDMTVARIAIGGLVLAGLWRLIVWIRDAPIRPDPWEAEYEQKINADDTLEVCRHCSTPQLSTTLSCPHCGCAIDSYNNWVPYVYSFSDRDVFRKTKSGQLCVKWLIVIGYLLLFFSRIGMLTGLFFCIFFNQRRIQRERLNTSNSVATPFS
ncbi:MAG: hypothetical protein WDM80_16105 [Limisphaerales bacterium]